MVIEKVAAEIKLFDARRPREIERSTSTNVPWVYNNQWFVSRKLAFAQYEADRARAVTRAAISAISNNVSDEMVEALAKGFSHGRVARALYPSWKRAISASLRAALSEDKGA